MTGRCLEIAVRRGEETVPATIGWRREGWRYAVTISSARFDTIDEVADDAFEALCRIRGHLEPLGWRIGVVGAQTDVWPSGMARDQGGGLRAYRVGTDRIGDLVDVFEPADPETVTTVEAQRAEADRRFELIRNADAH